ncbi:MAG: hypothetical protein JRN26_06480 [Nitrososphaerota archaeon]|jgi:predicted transcriptional regulator of viral defense system|nr:hypothetical protein [Nitrososphaerota archaeon]MDG6936508.1 hypothetical protein [Nitrososphaerota archaeon]MDG6944983.1 hypothetical protein [Nitrososphaerota archaeon]
MRVADVLQELARSGKRVFTVYDFAKVTGKPVPYSSLLLHKSRQAVRIERGKYFVHGTSIYEIASNIVFPSYVSLYSALQYYELIDQSIVRHSVISPFRKREISIGKAVIEFITVKPEYMYGYSLLNGAYVATPEKLFIDCLRFGVSAGEVLNALKIAHDEMKLSVDKIEEYAMKAGKSSVNRLGFLMELAGIDTGNLIDHIYRNYVSLHGLGKSGINRKWRVAYD